MTDDDEPAPPLPPAPISAKRLKWINHELEKMAMLKRQLNGDELRRICGIIAEMRALTKQDDNPEYRRMFKAAKLVRSVKGPRQPGAEPPRPAGLGAVLPSGIVGSRRLRLAGREVQGGLPGSGRSS